MSQPRFLFTLLCVLLPVIATAGETRLLRRPTVSRDLVAFAYASDLWAVPRAGGQARRLTATPFVETDPRFSPDGSQIAFTATVGGNTDVYVMSAAGGEPTRLTYHPGIDAVRGWSPDGRRVLFASTRGTLPTPGLAAYFRLWTVALSASGLPELLPIPRAFTGTYSSDGRRVAYEDVAVAFAAEWAQEQSSQWRHYRGGRTHPIRVITLADNSVDKLPWTNSNDTAPMWVGDTVYFLSDRNATTNLFSYEPRTKQVAQLTRHDDFDIMSASAGPDAIVYEQAGAIHLVETATRKPRRLAIEVAADFPWARPQVKKVASMIRSAVLSPTGVRAAFEARGDIFTVPAEKGGRPQPDAELRVHDRSPVWSPDGAQIAWLSDASGEYQLMIGEQTGAAKPREIALPSKAFFSTPMWSPDGKQLLLEDNHLNLWAIDIASGAASKLDTDTYDEPGRRFDAVWSPDSRWVAYSKSLKSHLRAIFLYSIGERKAYQVTDGLSDAIAPAFDAGGKYLYFLASTNLALRTGFLEMSSVDRPLTPRDLSGGAERERAVAVSAGNGRRAVPRRRALPRRRRVAPSRRPMRSHRLPRRSASTSTGIDQRILALAVPAADYSALVAGPAGTLFYAETPRAPARRSPSIAINSASAERRRFWRASARTRSPLTRSDCCIAPTATAGASSPPIGPRKSARAPSTSTRSRRWSIRARNGRRSSAKPGAFSGSTSTTRRCTAPIGRRCMTSTGRCCLTSRIAPIWDISSPRSAASLPSGTRICLGSGDLPGGDPVSVGLLGADYAIENGRYRIKKIYGGENWNPELQAPLSAPGIQVSEGDYLLEVNGRCADAADQRVPAVRGNRWKADAAAT